MKQYIAINNKLIACLISMSLLVLSSIDSAAATTPSPTPSKTPTVVPPTPTSTNTPIPSGSPSASPTATGTHGTPTNTATYTPTNTPTNTPTPTPEMCPSEGSEEEETLTAASAFSVPGFLAIEPNASSEDEIMFSAAAEGEVDPKVQKYKDCMEEAKKKSGAEKTAHESGCHGGLCKKDGCDKVDPNGTGETYNCCIRCGNDFSDVNAAKSCREGCKGMCGGSC
jgi:hypothetical protein